VSPQASFLDMGAIISYRHFIKVVTCVSVIG